MDEPLLGDLDGAERGLQGWAADGGGATGEPADEPAQAAQEPALDAQAAQEQEQLRELSLKDVMIGNWHLLTNPAYVTSAASRRNRRRVIMPLVALYFMGNDIVGPITTHGYLDPNERMALLVDTIAAVLLVGLARLPMEWLLPDMLVGVVVGVSTVVYSEQVVVTSPARWLQQALALSVTRSSGTHVFGVALLYITMLAGTLATGQQAFPVIVLTPYVIALILEDIDIAQFVKDNRECNDLLARARSNPAGGAPSRVRNPGTATGSLASFALTPSTVSSDDVPRAGRRVLAIIDEQDRQDAASGRSGDVPDAPDSGAGGAGADAALPPADVRTADEVAASGQSGAAGGAGAGGPLPPADVRAADEAADLLREAAEVAREAVAEAAAGDLQHPCARDGAGTDTDATGREGARRAELEAWLAHEMGAAAAARPPRVPDEPGDDQRRAGREAARQQDPDEWAAGNLEADEVHAAHAAMHDRVPLPPPLRVRRLRRRRVRVDSEHFPKVLSDFEETDAQCITSIIQLACCSLNPRGEGCCGRHILLLKLFRHVSRQLHDGQCMRLTPFEDFQCIHCGAMNQNLGLHGAADEESDLEMCNICTHVQPKPGNAPRGNEGGVAPEDGANGEGDGADVRQPGGQDPADAAGPQVLPEVAPQQPAPVQAEEP